MIEATGTQGQATDTAHTIKFPPAEPAFEPLVGEGEAIAILGLAVRKNPKSAMRWLIRSRRLAYVEISRGVYCFRRSDLAAYIDARRVPAAVRT